MPTSASVPQLDLKISPDCAVRVTFDAPATSSDGGWLLLRALDEASRTTADLAAALGDRRAPNRVEHNTATLVRQRVFQIAAGYEDANDATTLRHDPLLRVVCGRAPDGPSLASQPTLSRLENAATLRNVVRVQRAHEARWVASLDPTLERIVLDVDGTDDPTHGQQQLAFFNGFYDTTMLAPLLIFDHVGRLASARLRSGKHHGHQFAGAMLERLIRAAHARCPHATIVVRGDAAFSHAALLNRLLALRAELRCIELRLGLTPNSAVQRGGVTALAEATARAQRFGGVARYYDWITYQAEPWTAAVPVVLRAEVHEGGRTDLRAVIITAPPIAAHAVDRDPYAAAAEPVADARVAYETEYAPRGDAENRIKDFKRAIGGDRLSCHRFAANALRLLLHGAAYELLHALRLRQMRLPGASAVRPQLDTIRRTLLKVATVVRATARRIWLALPRAFPAAATFRALAAALAPPLAR